MANYTAADIKALREKTAAGMMDVKRALDEADGDMAQAEEILRVKGLKGVTKREGRTASNGLVAAKAENGVNSDGFTTIAQPAASAGAALRVTMAAGKFQGVIAAQTPIGSLMTTIRLSAA